MANILPDFQCVKRLTEISYDDRLYVVAIDKKDL